MAKEKLKLRLKSNSVKVAIVTFALFLLFSSLAAFSIIDLTAHNYNILIVASTVIIFMEVGAVQAFKTKGKSIDFFGVLGLLAGVVMLLTLGLTLSGVEGTFLTALKGVQGIVFGVLTISFFIETFVR